MNQQFQFPKDLVVGPGPHIGKGDSIPSIMWSVVAALIPALLVSAANFGLYALAVTIVSILSAVVTEAAIQHLRKTKITILDGSAVVTGILLAFTLPPNVPLYLPVIGSIFAIGIAKHAFGGLGMNIWNPALAGRAFLLAGYSGFMVMSKWPILGDLFRGDIRSVEAITRATPCAVLKAAPLAFFDHYRLWELFTGRVPGCIGETSAAALIIGGVFLIARRIVNWRMPLSYILSVMVLVVILPVHAEGGKLLAFWQAGFWAGPLSVLMRSLAHALSGGLVLGAFFMATDMVTSPLTNKGQVIFGAGCGFLVAIIRFYGGYPEGVCYSILIMNTLVWFIDRVTKPNFFGERANA
jgi:electron transport complex protein RnfD